jgi:hypothetical protein
LRVNSAAVSQLVDASVKVAVLDFLNSIQKSLKNPCQKQAGETRRDNHNPVDFGRHYFNLSHMAATDALSVRERSKYDEKTFSVKF